METRWAHNPEIVGSNPTPATITRLNFSKKQKTILVVYFFLLYLYCPLSFMLFFLFGLPSVKEKKFRKFSALS